jgi:hypothetical protein
MDFRIDTSGLDELQRRMERMPKSESVSFGDLFNPAFMRRYTQFESIETMFNASGYTVESQEDFAAIPDDEWDAFIAANTQFPNWLGMQKTAASERMKRQLGL